MLGLDGYGSDSGSGSETEKPQPTKNQPESTKSSRSTSKTPLSSAKTTKRTSKKITIGLPALSRNDSEEQDSIESERPAAKRQRTGAGASSLMNMLPTPKQKTTVAPPPQERVLGGGRGPGLKFNERKTVLPYTSTTLTEGDEELEEEDEGPRVFVPTKTASNESSLPFLPPSLVKGKPNTSLEDKWEPVKKAAPRVSAAPPVDDFSSGKPKATPTTSTSSQFSLPAISSAPSIPTFEPPEPTPQDPYPGYYQLPSGSWTAYDSTYYEKFRKKWQSEYDAYVRGLEKGAIKGFEGYEEGASEVDAMKEMERAKVEIKEREERKALTKAAGPVEEPKVKFNASKLSGIARSRHQLSTLLRDAYENRETLEEKIAEGRRNRKEAGNKYGF
ncbi:hypothetical protein AGABI1DRAFT_111236 [Agaricus bisporus var. burnettii JB137-S8]|uniref:Mitotic checkpoint regulator, MAD2B-interacting-domain-containing protein n=1 Tax=Agaricus bisporus var. burnettii (strain JB137-S8 / ATCC MYA-4627 / FGSC 10392) TaxID=597362 RepID=K5XHB2_AGABU|nr:uncharacterized protein AGABI1DRAFT_111236 [Agaricus bisporus var. burnettii JB137-S8]EKM82647.1 hypothetical protein AGABI1DRAFT_111236 [Agaricus bisporus var. burnettii JB137-S8]